MKPIEYTKKTFLDPNDILTDEEEHNLDILMHRIGEVMRKHRIMLKTHF
jgi:hypothetical protein